MIPGDSHTHELVIIRPDGKAQRWASYANRQAADVERAKLIRQGFFAIIRRLEREDGR